MKIDGRVYTVPSHQGLSIEAPAGTPIDAGSTRNLHRKGDLLFAVQPQLESSTVPIR